MRARLARLGTAGDNGEGEGSHVLLSTKEVRVGSGKVVGLGFVDLFGFLFAGGIPFTVVEKKFSIFLITKFL